MGVMTSIQMIGIGVCNLIVGVLKASSKYVLVFHHSRVVIAKPLSCSYGVYSTLSQADDELRSRDVLFFPTLL